MRIMCAPYYVISNLDESEKSEKNKESKKDEKKRKIVGKWRCEKYKTEGFDWKINQNDLHTIVHRSINVNRVRFEYNLCDLNWWE